MEKYEKIAQELGVSLKQIDTVLTLTAEGSTIPFIARYRKERDPPSPLSLGIEKMLPVI